MLLYIKGLPLAKLSAVCFVGDAVWLLGQELSQSPWDLVRKRLSQRITIHLKGKQCGLEFEVNFFFKLKKMSETLK